MSVNNKYTFRIKGGTGYNIFATSILTDSVIIFQNSRVYMSLDFLNSEEASIYVFQSNKWYVYNQTALFLYKMNESKIQKD